MNRGATQMGTLKNADIRVVNRENLVFLVIC